MVARGGGEVRRSQEEEEVVVEVVVEEEEEEVLNTAPPALGVAEVGAVVEPLRGLDARRERQRAKGVQQPLQESVVKAAVDDEAARAHVRRVGRDQPSQHRGRQRCRGAARRARHGCLQCELREPLPRRLVRRDGGPQAVSGGGLQSGPRAAEQVVDWG